MISPALANWIVWLALLYLLAGAVFAVPFALRNVGRLDPVAKQGTWGFRVLIVPGTVALWPFLAWRLARGVPPQDRSAHGDAAR